MLKNKKWFGVIVLLVAVILTITACTTGSAEPTLDPNVIYTEAALTVAAQLTQEAPPTATVEPTAIPTNTPEPTATTAPELPTSTPESDTAAITPTAQPTATLKPASASDLLDSAEMILLYPEDDHVFYSGSVFTPKIGFRNMGDNTWNENYSFRYLSGSTFGIGSKFVMSDYGSQDSVGPSEEIVFTLPNMTAPQEEGRYLSNWCFYNNREAQNLPPQCFFLVTFQIIVDNP